MQSRSPNGENPLTVIGYKKVGEPGGMKPKCQLGKKGAGSMTVARLIMCEVAAELVDGRFSIDVSSLHLHKFSFFMLLGF